jgi:hypothetical protein
MVMAAVVRIGYASGAGPTLANAEAGIKYNQEESLSGTTAPIPKPTATGTEFSWPKVFRLEVTTGDATSLSNLRYRYNGSAPATGLNLWVKDDGASYAQVSASADTPSGSNGATPTGYSAMPSSLTQYDAGSYSASITGGKGDYFRIALGVSNTYAGSAGQAIALPSLEVAYDEG